MNNGMTLSNKLWSDGSGNNLDESNNTLMPRNDAQGHNNENPPLVPAVMEVGTVTNANDASILYVNDAVPANEEQPLLFMVGDESCSSASLSFSATSSSSATLVQAPQAQQRDDIIAVEQNDDAVSAEEENGIEEKARMKGAGIAVGILGSLLCGPFLGIIFGFGAAYATRSEGAVGDSARALGDVALHAHERALEINQKHKVMERCQKATEKTWEKMKEWDERRQNPILTPTQNFFKFCATSIQDFCTQHRVMERTADTTGHAVAWATAHISHRIPVSENDNSNNDSHQSSNTAPSTVDSSLL